MCCCRAFCMDNNAKVTVKKLRVMKDGVTLEEALAYAKKGHVITCYSGGNWKVLEEVDDNATS